jgi:hypothetical protein
MIFKFSGIKTEYAYGKIEDIFANYILNSQAM